MDRRDRLGRTRRDPPVWFVLLAVLGLATAGGLWPLLTGLTLTEWMRDVTGAAVR